MRQGIKDSLLVVTMSFALGLILWVLDSAAQGLLRREGAFVDLLLRPSPAVVLGRAVVVGLAVASGVLSYRAGLRRAKKETAPNGEDGRYRRLVEQSPDAIILQGEGGIIHINRSGAQLLGSSDVDGVLGRSIWDFIPSEYKPILRRRSQQIRDEGTGIAPIEVGLNRLDGRQIEVEIVAIPYTTTNPPMMQFVIHDITARKWVEEQIRQRNIELSALNAIAATVSQTLDLSKTLDEALNCVMQLDVLGGNAQGMIFLRAEESESLFLAAHRGAPDDHPCLQWPPRVGECLCGLAVQLGTPVFSVDAHHDERHSRSWPGMPRHRDVCLPLTVHGRVIGAMDVRLPAEKCLDEMVVDLLTAVADQVSVAIENARLFEEVKHQSERLRILGARLAETEEAERKRLARELHDRVGEGLTALGINLNLLRTRLPKDAGEEIDRTVADSLALLEETTRRIRDVMAELRPPMLDDYGLLATLRWYGSQFSRRVGIDVEVSGDEPDPRLPASVESVAFRILTEALTNVAKHAKASRVWVGVRVDGANFYLSVLDDGVGFDTTRAQRKGEETGWGLQSMAERAEAAGGRFHVESDPALGGTHVLVEVPR